MLIVIFTIHISLQICPWYFPVYLCPLVRLHFRMNRLLPPVTSFHSTHVTFLDQQSFSHIYSYFIWVGNCLKYWKMGADHLATMSLQLLWDHIHVALYAINSFILHLNKLPFFTVIYNSRRARFYIFSFTILRWPVISLPASPSLSCTLPFHFLQIYYSWNPPLSLFKALSPILVLGFSTTVQIEPSPKEQPSPLPLLLPGCHEWKPWGKYIPAGISG